MGKESKLIWYGVVAGLLRSLFAVTPNWVAHGGPPKFATVIPHSFLVAVPAVLLTWLLANKRKDYAWTFIPVCTLLGVATALGLAATSPAWREMPDPVPKLVEMSAAYVVTWGLASGLSVLLIGAIAKRSVGRAT